MQQSAGKVCSERPRNHHEDSKHDIESIQGTRAGIPDYGQQYIIEILDQWLKVQPKVQPKVGDSGSDRRYSLLGITVIANFITHLFLAPVVNGKEVGIHAPAVSR